jgi:hypothetical protein
MMGLMKFQITISTFQLNKSEFETLNNRTKGVSKTTLRTKQVTYIRRRFTHES